MRFGVVMIANVFYPSIGGAQTHTLRLSQKLKERGVEVMVVTRHHKGLAEYEEVQGIPTYRVGKAYGRKSLSATSFIIEALRVLYAQKARYDILHCHQMVAPMTIGLLTRLIVRKPLVINPHARGPIGDIAVLTQRRPVTGALRLAAARRWGSAFVSISNDIRDELSMVGVDEAKLWDIPNGVDIEHFKPADQDERSNLRLSLGLPRGPLVLFTGRLASVKGLDILAAAWPQVLQHIPDAHLVLLGEGEERSALETQVQQLGIAERVMFAGACSDVAPYLRAADVFVLPSRSEGLPVALLEAMATALPIVATNVGGMAQLLENDISARLVPVGDVDALAMSLSHALKLREELQWGDKARQQVVSHYSLDAVAERYIEMYEALLDPYQQYPLTSDRISA